MTADPYEREQNGDKAPAETQPNLPPPPVVLVGGMHDDEKQPDSSDDSSDDQVDR